MTALSLVSSRKRKETPAQRRDRIRQHDRFAGARARIRMVLDRHHHFSIEVKQTRATIGETFEHARQAELLVTYRRGKPITVLSEALETFLREHTKIRTMGAEELFTEINNFLAKPWAKKRTPVRHLVWRDPAERRSAKKTKAKSRKRA
jgi:hypothetical protein